MEPRKRYPYPPPPAIFEQHFVPEEIRKTGDGVVFAAGEYAVAMKNSARVQKHRSGWKIFRRVISEEMKLVAVVQDGPDAELFH
jgi:hypothetical protein